MILIIGSSHDDMLYFENVIKNRQDELILDRYKAITGTIFNQSVLLIQDIYSSYISSAITTYIIQKYYIILVFVVGKCTAFSQNLKDGDIAISKQVVIGDVDQCEVPGTKLGQIPGLNQFYLPNSEIIDNIETSLEQRTYSRHFLCSYVSSNTNYRHMEQIEPMLNEGRVFGIFENVVFDSETGGIAVACKLCDIPFIAIKVVEGHIGEKANLENYMKVLRQYASVGKAVISCIGEIGRSDVLRK